jgi:hypothetical protein
MRIRIVGHAADRQRKRCELRVLVTSFLHLGTSSTVNPGDGRSPRHQRISIQVSRSERAGALNATIQTQFVFVKTLRASMRPRRSSHLPDLSFQLQSTPWGA